MVIKILLTLALFSYFGYAQFQRSTSGIVSGLTALSSLVGLILVWNPDLSTVVAHAAGVGRGADLIFYAFIAAAAFISLYLHLRIETSNRMITDLARAVALSRPLLPAGAEES